MGHLPEGVQMGVLPGNMGEWSEMLLSVDGIKVCDSGCLYALF